ncbi:MAG TPA: aminoacyl-tRNA hydrolase [Flavobacteriales bacterium]|nr:aminoacyl-tRNA hydrolase [Flavobacteriales bacterium]
MKILIAGLGNMGSEYENTRHNVGFKIADALAAKYNVLFSSDRYAHVSELKIKNKHVMLIKPTTFMNLSGNAVRYWMQKEKIDIQNILILVDELALPFGTIRIKGSGSDGGHNGLKNIQETLQAQNYPRLRFGIAAEYTKGRQVDYVLGEWTREEKKLLPLKIERSVKAIETFCLAGLNNAMNEFNKKA